MADANTSSTQQASDAQHVDNMTSMQQSTPDAPSGARSDAPVQTSNVGSQDGPSQLNSNPNGNSTNNNNLGAGLQNSVINGGSTGNLGGGAGPGGDAAGGALNGLAGNGGAGGTPGQGGTGNAATNNGGGGAGSPGIAAAVFGGTGVASTGNAGTVNGATAGGEGGGNPPPANTNAPTNGTNTTIPTTATTTAEPTLTAVDANVVSNSSGQPQFNGGNVTEAGGVNNAIAGTPSASNTLISADGSAFTPVTTPSASTSGYGTYTINADGTWNYTLNNSNTTVQALNVGGTLTDTFTVSTIDGAQEVVTVRITGANDSAVISGVTSGSVTEAGGVNNAISGTPTATGILISADVDNANTFTPVTTPSASTSGYGTYTINADGTWNYTLNNSNTTVQALNVGGTLTDTFTVSTIDGAQEVVTVRITGANDSAEIATATIATFASFTGNPSSSYFQDAYYGDLTLRLETETLSYNDAESSLGKNVVYSNAVETYKNALTSYTNAVSLGTATPIELLTLHNDLEIALAVKLELSAERDIAQSTMLGTQYEIAHFDTNRNSTLINQGVISITDIDSASRFQSDLLISHDGNIGTLLLGVDGSYTYQITSVMVNSNGRFDPIGSASERYILESFTTLFNASNHHVDTFTVTSADFTTKDVNFILKGDHNILGYVINTPGVTDRQESAGNLSFSSGTHDVRVIEGGNFNPNFGPNIGSLILNEDGSYTYTVSEANIRNYEFGDPSIPGDSGHGLLISGRDTFIITSTLGADTTIQEMSFNIFQQAHINIASPSNLLLSGVESTDNVFAFTSWDAIKGGSHSISNFELGDRVDLSSLLNDPVDQLSGTIYIDPSHLGSQYSTLSALAPAAGGGAESLPVASVNGVWSVADLMWNAKSGIDQTSALNEISSWTETLDLTHVTRTSDNHFAGAGGWSMDITSTHGSTTSTTGDTSQILFDGNPGQVTIHTIDGLHEINNIDKIVWHVT